MSHNPQSEDDYYAIAYNPKDRPMNNEQFKQMIKAAERELRDHYEKILARISMPFGWELRLERDLKSDSINPRFWVRVHAEHDKCVRSGDDYSWDGREWILRDDMTDSEVLRTAFLATRGAVEHELYEMFKIDGQRPFDPHLNLTKLAKFAADPANTDQPEEG